MNALVKVERPNTVERLLHYSAEPLGGLYSTEHGQYRCGAYKTCGLWVSVEGEFDWEWWARAEDFGVDSLACVTEVILSSDHNVLWLRGEKQIDWFSDLYVNKADYPFRYGEPDWVRLRSLYQGVIIAPYVWERRLTSCSHWYYGWDCASGVIWDAAAVAELRPMSSLLKVANVTSAAQEPQSVSA